MPFALAIIGAALILVAIRNSHSQLAELLKGDFTGSPNFLVWLAAIGIVGGLGYVPGLEKPSRWLLILIFLSMFISNRGVFAQLVHDISSPPAATPAPAEPTLPSEFPVKVSGTGGGGGGILGELGGVAKAVSGFAGLIGV